MQLWNFIFFDFWTHVSNHWDLRSVAADALASATLLQKRWRLTCNPTPFRKRPNWPQIPWPEMNPDDDWLIHAHIWGQAWSFEVFCLSQCSQFCNRLPNSCHPAPFVWRELQGDVKNTCLLPPELRSKKSHLETLYVNHMADFKKDTAPLWHSSVTSCTYRSFIHEDEVQVVGHGTEPQIDSRFALQESDSQLVQTWGLNYGLFHPFSILMIINCSELHESCVHSWLCNLSPQVHENWGLQSHHIPNFPTKKRICRKNNWRNDTGQAANITGSWGSVATSWP